jgi:demethylmenaquinone methyltransferase/2-methoxy-6-polyprenyl-1,4-benzoquinol methylase
MDSTTKGQAQGVRRLFAGIARRYDLANRWMTWGQDLKWRREVLRRAELPAGGSLLDIGTGTGDLALGALQQDSSIHAAGLDFTPQMIQQGRRRTGGQAVAWLNADALDLPFPDGCFDTVVSGYLLRNVTDVGRALCEQYRVLKPGGRMACLDTTPLPGDMWHLPARLYVRHVIPLIGRLVAGDAAAYRYLPASTARFLSAEQLAQQMTAAGFKQVKFRRFMGGAMAIHWGVK